jgi:predicted phage terminase large subunit-like protein
LKPPIIASLSQCLLVIQSPFTSLKNLPAYYLGQYPNRRIITASHTAELAYTFSRRVRNKILDPRWPFDFVTVAGDKSAVKAWDIAGHLGGYMAVGVGGSPAGHGANLIIIDDPVGSVAEAESDASREAVWEWYQGTIRDRLEPGGSMIITATRWNEEDLTGHLLTEMRNGGEIWHHLHLPALNRKGEALWPERWPVSALQEIKKAVGSRVWESRFQGNPVPLEGGLLQRDWWQFYKTIPKGVTGHIQSWDMSFRETKSGSFVVGQVWAVLGADRYLLDQIRFRGDFTVTVKMVRDFSRKWPQAKIKLIENKANGPAIVATLRHEISGLVEINPVGGKLARASAISPQVESHNVFLPDPDTHPWVLDFIEECASFPHGAHDDQVDAMSQALARLEQKTIPTSGISVVQSKAPLGRLARAGGLSRPFLGRLGR